MTGSWPVRVKAVRPFTIHGDLYYELRAQRTDTSAGELLLRVPQYAAKGEPVAGQLLDVSFLMGQVTAVNIIAEQSP